MSGFANPIIGGGGALVYPSVHSPDYVAGVSGWSENKDGSAEFNNLTIRGTFDGTNYVIDSAGAFFYSGTPALHNLILSIANASGTDAHGNAYPAGLAMYDTSGNARLEMGTGANPFFQLVNASGALIGLLSNRLDALLWYADTGSAVQGAIQASIAGQAGTDSFGNVFPQGVKIFSGVFDGTNYEINSSGAFFYSGAPAAGNLIASITSASGTDSHGNAYQAGFVSYNTATGDYTQIHGGLGITVNDPTNAAFSGGELALASVGSANDSTQINSPMAVSTDVQAILALQRGPSGALGTAHFLNTAIQATAGTAAHPTLITTDGWNSLGSLGATGWTFNHARYRMSPLGGVEFDFSATSTANPAPAVTPTAFPNTLPAAYRPAFGRAYPLGYASSISSGTNWPRVLVGTGGTVTVALPGGGGIGTAAAGQFIMPLD